MVISKDKLPVFIYEEEAYSGVKKVAGYVRRDMSLVFGKKPEKASVSDGDVLDTDKPADTPEIIFGTIGHSPLIDKFIKDKKINIHDLEGKREVFQFRINDNSLIIAGSDKRGTIYGLFHLSKLLGVSPFVDWSDLKPKKLDKLKLTSEVNMISKEPSVKYRGFFINDEWPAFGNFALHRFGGINAKLYEVVFTMLLRMNGNYLWPAMWASCFAEDGPGLLSAELADELGVVMGLSHHEPCLRHGEEYSHVRGKDSIYGDAWDFRANRDGITRFWRDGLKRNGHLENVITIGMRGERDSMIMGEEATLSDNIGLLRDVINTQNELIKEEVNPDLQQVPRMLALYKEVEPFFFGDENTKGLMGDECLDDVILLLCDDNHGYLRSRPCAFDSALLDCLKKSNDEDDKPENKKCKNGYGLYYHFDYHGDPVSYEWVCSTHLPEVWEELTEAYETGIRDLFIVNVGDVGFNEFALNYFLDFSYDYDKWGINNVNSTEEYTREWFEFNFKGVFDEASFREGNIYIKLADTWTECMRLNHRRRPEHMNEEVYPARDFSKSISLLNSADAIINTIDDFEKSCITNKDAFIQLISYQVKASMNLLKMWIYKGFNRFAAKRGLYVTNETADKLEETFDIDSKLTEQVHEINNCLYYGFALASHIGFKHWNDEESAYPTVERLRTAGKKGVVAFVEGSDEYTTGQEWTRKTLHINGVQKANICIALHGQQEVKYKIECDSSDIKLSCIEGVLTKEEPYKIIEVSLHNSAQRSSSEASTQQSLPEASGIFSCIHILSERSDIEIEVNFSKDSCFMFEASQCNSITECDGERIVTIDSVGNTTDGIKLYRLNEDGRINAYLKASDGMLISAPHREIISNVSYSFSVSEDSIYSLTFTFLPCNPRKPGDRLHFGYSINDSEIKTKAVLKPDHAPGVSKDWGECVLTHERDVTFMVELKAGQNILNYYPLQAENVLLKITLTKIMAI